MPKIAKATEPLGFGTSTYPIASSATMLTRIRCRGVRYVANSYYKNGFTTVAGKWVHDVPFEVLGPQFCQICGRYQASHLRVQQETVYRPKTEASRTEITLARLLCNACNKLERLPLKCACGEPAVLSIGAKIVHDGKEYWFRDQVCEACHENWDARRDQFLREAIVLVRPVTHFPSE